MSHARATTTPRRALLLAFAIGLGHASAAGAAPDHVDGGPAPILVQDDLGIAQRITIELQIEAGVRALRQRGVVPQLGAAPAFGWPLAFAPGFTDYGYHGISNFVDQNPAFPNALLDYNCGNRTYDTAAGYNHSGTDIFLWPFAWKKVEAGEVHIVAAAPGTIVFKSDGNFDHNCAFNNGDWNAVYVQHADGSVAWYGHMKSGSTTPKLIGEAVALGEYLGVVGSSGSSTGPHLHFEVHSAGGSDDLDLIDPFAGPCNALNAATWWQSQRPYYDSAINAITTGSAPPVFPACPNVETSNATDTFQPGDPIVFTSFYRDQLESQTAQHTIYRPDGSVFDSWSHHSTLSFYPATWWYWSYDSFAPGGPTGTWRYEIVFESTTYVHEFVIGMPTPPPACTPSSCADGDACTDDLCDPAVGCSHPVVAGAAGIPCLCNTTLGECSGQASVPKIDKKLSKACTALSGIDATVTAKQRTKLVTKAVKLLKKAGHAAKGATKGKHPKLTSECGNALTTLFADLTTRALALKNP
jgi:murein DD-endopeptidase MepM/ murein hydrolase activator NlpD